MTLRAKEKRTLKIPTHWCMYFNRYMNLCIIKAKLWKWFFFILLTHLGSWLAMYILALNSSMNISLTFKSICSVLSRMVSKLSRCKNTVRLCIFMWNVFSNKGRETDRFSTPEISVRPAAVASVSFKRQSKALYNELVVNPL